MYYSSTVSEKEKNIIFADKDVKQLYEDLKVLSDDFTLFDEDGLQYDDLIKKYVTEQLKKEKKATTKKTKKPNRLSKVDFLQQLIKRLADLLNISIKGVNEITAANENFIWENYNKGKTPLQTAKLFVKNNKPKAATKLKKVKTKAEIFAELFEQLNTEKAVDAEQVKTIVENILSSKKICFDDLCADLVKAIDETTKIKIEIPNRPTKAFKNDTPNILKIIDDVCLGNNVMLIGGAGTGKTFLAEQVAKVLGLETEVINCNQFTSPIEINGGQTIEGYQEGKLIKAWSEGKLLILDELPKLDPNTAGILNEALAKTSVNHKEDRAFITNTRGDRFRKKEGFGVIATGNVYPNTESTAYGANNKQDLSLLDRFGGSIYEIEKNPSFEKKKILPNHLFIWHICDKIRTLIEVNKWEAQVSIRFMETSLKVYLAEMNCIKKGTDMSERKTYKDVIDSFVWTFTDVQQLEIKREIKYKTLFEKHQYRKMDINKNPL